ncbi:MAG: flagellar biosynthesis regulator FlaF [Pseudomonadota bacterium]
MNALLQAKTAYGQNASPIRTNRGTEYAAFSRITHRIKGALSNPKDFPDLVAALHENRRLWLVLAADVADPENGLPEKLRAQIFYLAEFTAQHTDKVLQKSAAANVLVDINMSVMRGLGIERSRS